MQQIRTQPAGPKAFRLYSIARDNYCQQIGERALTVYAALTYYVHPKTLEGAIPLKLLAETVEYPLTTVRRLLYRLWQEGLITITPQWDAFGCVQQPNIYALHPLPLKPLSRPQPRLPRLLPARGRGQSPRLTLLRYPVHARPTSPGGASA
ncbi:MAG: hypothetical protein FJZ47_12795 [Candidatus Tectomicrobia bacterium]|uniref:Uncharacterized protein n=1 Tax=Tectimicrobiota bacterium TaxID=2528274 RepID=A0A937W3W6_UNCTE|nr:hypothetical protein [Candidatus Tectomicrobia bacterium]